MCRDVPRDAARCRAMLRERKRAYGPRRSFEGGGMSPIGLRRLRCWRASTTHLTQMRSNRAFPTLKKKEEEEEEVYTRPLPLTSCQEDRLGLDYTVLCHG